MTTPSPSPESQPVVKAINAFASWTSVGGSIGLLTHFLIGQDWFWVLLTFPLTLATGAWANYTKNFIETFNVEIGKWGNSNAEALTERLSRANKTLQLRFARADERYLRAQANACRYYQVEGVSRAQWNAKTTLEEGVRSASN